MGNGLLYFSKELNEACRLYHILKVYQSDNSHESEGRFNYARVEVRAHINKVNKEGWQNEPIFKKVIEDLINDYELNK